MNKTIKKALKLCETTDFPLYVDKLNSYSPEVIKFFIGDFFKVDTGQRIKQPRGKERAVMAYEFGNSKKLPDFNNIYDARDRQLSTNKILLKQHSGWSDAEQGKEEFLTIVSMHIIREMEVLKRIGRDEVVENMDVVGSLWANCETLKEHYRGVPAEVATLYKELISNKYISGSMDVFTHVLKYRRPLADEKIKWLTSKSDAIYFQRELKFSLAEFNNCFFYEDGKKFGANNRQPDAPDPRPPLPDILKNFSTT